MVPESEEQSRADHRRADAGTSARPPGHVISLRFRPEQHLRSGADFERVYARKCRGSDQHLLVFGDLNGTSRTRIGLSVSRKHGNAVQRNRLKRLLREAFRLSHHRLPTGLDLVLIPRQGMESTLTDYRQSLVRSANTVARKLKSSAE